MKSATCALAALAFVIGCGTAEDESAPAEGVLYQGEIYSPEELQRLGVEIQHWAVDAELSERRLVAGFDSAEESIQYLSERQNARLEDGDPSFTCEEAFFYDDPYFGGSYFYFPRGRQESSLLDIGWDDRIHSLRTPSCPSVTILYEHPNMGGKSLSFGPSTNVDSLADYKISTFHSWRDKTSSIRVVGNMYYSASNTSSAQQNTTNQNITLTAGQTIQLGTCTYPSSYGSGDTYIRLFGPDGAQVAVNDDSCGYLSYLQHTATTSGTYQIRAGCFSSVSCSGMVAYGWE